MKRGSSVGMIDLVTERVRRIVHDEESVCRIWYSHAHVSCLTRLVGRRPVPRHPGLPCGQLSHGLRSAA